MNSEARSFTTITSTPKALARGKCRHILCVAPPLTPPPPAERLSERHLPAMEGIPERQMARSRRALDDIDLANLSNPLSARTSFKLSRYDIELEKLFCLNLVFFCGGGGGGVGGGTKDTRIVGDVS